MNPVLPITLVTSVHPLQRDLATGAVFCDVPGAVVLRYDLLPDGLRRVVSDAAGIVEDVLVPLEHACLGCAQREDVLPTVAAIAASGRWSDLVLALPVAADPAPLLAALCAEEDLREVVAVRGVVAVVEAAGVVEDLLGDALLSERSTASGDDDERAVGEVLAQQLDEADLVVADGIPDEHARTLLAHLCGPAVPVLPLDRVDATQLTAPLGGGHRTSVRADPLAVHRPPVTDTCGVWTTELTSAHTLHPGRLLERIEDLGAGRLRARGTFRLTTRPGTVCEWNGAGGQLSIGVSGTWRPGERSTHLVVTGTDPADRRRVRAAFADVLATTREEAAAQAADGAVPGEDGFEAWLGPRDPHVSAHPSAGSFVAE
ncbi:G3E family GTPase [Kineococcus rhizosphaerae]|uniref:G3E family GTPase n=1 Tax=Kineococcus rhizosphaerae TaxID=559628 RepID=A0A2T0QZR3_9ACTN|nr:G3E family GTPase [Kineococcus rhizosphaerae]